MPQLVFQIKGIVYTLIKVSHKLIVFKETAGLHAAVGTVNTFRLHDRKCDKQNMCPDSRTLSVEMF